jgi:hypothetical protein
MLNDGLFGDFRLSTLICWRRTRISASSRALDRNSLVSTHAINMRKSIIWHQHHPIRRRIASPIEFQVGTGISITDSPEDCQPDRISGRDRGREAAIAEYPGRNVTLRQRTRVLDGTVRAGALTR